jgi:hypothetical protein
MLNSGDGDEIEIILWMPNAKSGSNRQLHGFVTAWSGGGSAPSVQAIHSIRWTDSASNITAIGIECDTADGMGIGGDASLHRTML